jgi:Protein of unknown function (DUF1573)
LIIHLLASVPLTANIFAQARGVGATPKSSTREDFTTLPSLELLTLQEPLKIDLGQCEVGTHRKFVLPVTNKLALALNPKTVSHSCKCIAIEVVEEVWNVGSEKNLKLVVQFPENADRKFRQLITINDSNTAIAPIRLNIEATVNPSLSVNPPIFRIKNSSKICEFDCVLTASKESDSIAEIKWLTSGLKVVETRQKQQSASLRFQVDPSLLFSGAIDQSALINVNIVRNNQPMAITLPLRFLFEDVLIAVPTDVMFIKSESSEMLVHKLLLKGEGLVVEGIEKKPAEVSADVVTKTGQQYPLRVESRVLKSSALMLTLSTNNLVSNEEIDKVILHVPGREDMEIKASVITE